MMRPINGQNGGMIGMNKDAVINATIASEKARQEKESGTQNPDFANGRGDDPRARGAESQMDFIMSDNK